MAVFVAEDDAEIEALIQRELDELGENDLDLGPEDDGKVDHEDEQYDNSEVNANAVVE